MTIEASGPALERIRELESELAAERARVVDLRAWFVEWSASTGWITRAAFVRKLDELFPSASTTKTGA